MTVYGVVNPVSPTTGGTINSLVASTGGTVSNGPHVLISSPGEVVSIMIFGTATLSAVNGTAAGTLTNANGQFAFLTVNTGVVIVNINGSTYNFPQGQQLQIAGINLTSHLTYSATVDLSNAAAAPITLMNGTFTGTANGVNALQILQPGGASPLIAASPFNGYDVTTATNATTASNGIAAILTALNTTIVKLNAMDSSLNGYRDNISDTIRELGTTVESMQSTDVTDAMSDIARAQQEISYSMAVWQVQRKEENEAVRAMLSTVAG